MNRILVTGAEGFVGSHLVKVLKETLDMVVPTCYPPLKPKHGKYVELDIMNLDLVREVFKSHNPDVIFHLAAVSSVAKSFIDRPSTYNTNIIGTINLLESALSLNKKIKFIFVSTCEVYGGGEGLKEDAPILLKNPYAVSKYACELISKDYAGNNIDVMILRPFNHTGPGQSDDFVLPSIARQIAEIERGKKAPLIEVGNIEIKREFMNVNDVVNAYKLAIEKFNPGEIYNISSNQSHSLKEALNLFKKFAKTDFEIKINPARLRKTDISVLTGNGEKFSRQTGWSPRIPFEKTIEDLLNYWRARIQTP
uniref:NAD-dependent epimerase/dehydratase family protein n=1 Tax=candidate division WOR-3 bacterium TaxID=2052148 RepID=A0A7V1EJ61_UNCW3